MRLEKISYCGLQTSGQLEPQSSVGAGVVGKRAWSLDYLLEKEHSKAVENLERRGKNDYDLLITESVKPSSH